MKRRIGAFLLIVAFLGCASAYGADPSAMGTYISKDNKNEYLSLSPNGTFYLKQRTRPYNMERPYTSIEGSYSLQGEDLILKLPDGGEARGKIQKDAFVDSDGKTWTRQNAPAPTQDLNLRPRKSMKP